MCPLCNGSQATGGLQIFTRKPTNGSQADVRLAIGDKGQKQASVQMSTGNDQVQPTAGIAHEQVKAVSAQNSPLVNPDIDGYRNNSGNVSGALHQTSAMNLVLCFSKATVVMSTTMCITAKLRFNTIKPPYSSYPRTVIIS